jgi:5-methylcytosine-specific restriction endonuclease McrBC regulatory subunit McrC
LTVAPKIPIPHFVHIAREALAVDFRTDASPTSLSPSTNFVELLLRWFVDTVAPLVRRGLPQGYRLEEAELPIARGTLDVRRTTMGWLAGRPTVHSSFDEFDTNTPLNRVLKCALQAASASALLPPGYRKEVVSLLCHLESVGTFTPGDLRVRLDRGHLHYQVALSLAVEILRATGRALEGGSSDSPTFLISTPALIEDGIRAILKMRLHPVHVSKGGKVLSPSAVSVNPDLLIGTAPFTGDVKYKIAAASWNRGDLGQAVFFAAAFESPLALVVAFRETLAGRPPALRVGRYSVDTAMWDVSAADPRRSEDQVVDEVETFLRLRGTDVA